MSMLLKVVIPFYWQPISLSFKQGTASSVKLSAFLSNPEDKVIGYSALGSLPSGVTLAGDTVSYNGTGPVASISVRFQATSDNLAIESDTTPVTITQAPQSPPAWSASTPSSLGTFIQASGGTFSLAPYGTDPDGDTLTYTRAGTAQDTAPGTVKVNSTTGVVTIPVALPVASYSLVVRLNDGNGGTADKTFTFSVTTVSMAEEVIAGWDWRLPATVQPTDQCGVYTMANSAYPSGWPGKKIRDVSVHWAELEPSIGNYNFSSITSHLNNLAYDGVLLNVRGWTVTTTNDPSEVSAPNWVYVYDDQGKKTTNTLPAYPTETTTNKGTIKSLVCSAPAIKDRWLRLIAALGNAGILTSQRLYGAIIHSPGSTRGEEYSATQSNAAASNAAVTEFVRAWATAAGANKKVLMWTDDRGNESALAGICDVAFDAGIGARGGAIEGWLWNLYTPGIKKYTQQTWANGYLDADDAGPTISEGRGWLDENEAAGLYNTPSNALQQQNYRMANLRMLQMRRRLMWVVGGYKMNPEMDKWLSLEAGKLAGTSPDAWCCLMRTWTKSGGAIREIKNFERWLYQRDVAGAMTVPSTGVLQVNHGRDQSLIDNPALFPTSYHYINLARQGQNGQPVRLTLDPNFLSGPRAVAVKVTWHDWSNEQWSLTYPKTSGETGTKTFPAHTATNAVRTQTFVLTDFTATSGGVLNLVSAGNTPFMFVRVIKL